MRLIARRRVYEGKVLDLDVDELEEPQGVRAVREVVRHRGSAAVLAVDEGGRMMLVRQYRYPVDQELWELPAGLIDRGETAEQGARRELEEEVGLQAREVAPLCVFYSTPGFCDEVMNVFRATGLTTVPARPEADERLEARWFDPAEARQLIDRGELRDAKTLVALLLEERRG